MQLKPARIVICTLLFALVAFLGLEARADTLLTVAEKSDYRATSRHADVMDFCQQLAKLSPVVRLSELGTSLEGRKLPLVILADPPVSTADEASKSNKLVILAFGNIHAGEVDGKEALLMLARDLALAQERPLLKDLIIVFAPIFNADGNERIARTNRPDQAGPVEGVGERANAQGLDLNRDFVKLETPEVRALVRFLNRWNPVLVVDMHTTNGSYHRYTLTYDGPRHPALNDNLVATVRDKILPDVGRRLEQRSGYKATHYGNFNREHTRWEPTPAHPRYGFHYLGFRNTIGILSESYVYAPYRDRVLAGRDFVKSCLEYAAENSETLRKATASGTADKSVALRSRLAPMPATTTVLGFVEEQKEGRRVATKEPRDYQVEYLGRSEPILSVPRPYAYLVPPSFSKAVENLQLHGIELEELREDIELDVEVYRLEKITRAAQPFQKHRLVTVQAVSSRKEGRRVEAGTILVRMGQPLGTLAAFLLEPQSEDGLCTWNFLDDALKEGQDYPVLRSPTSLPVVTGRVRPLAQDRTLNKPITFDMVYGSFRSFNLGGTPVSGLSWLDDGEHYLQVREGRLYKVHARSGRLEPFVDPEKLASGLRTLPTLSKQRADALARGTQFQMNAQRTGFLFEHENDLYFARFDGSQAVRLTKSPGRKELTSFSPDGRFVAFVRDGNLHVVEIETQNERRLTTDGGGLVANGKADWVYYEEVLGRNWRAYWWSPDSERIAFLRFDDAPIHKFTLIDQIPIRQRIEATTYPKAGDPNPLVKVGIVAVTGGSVTWPDLKKYPEAKSLIVRVGWLPAGQVAYCYVQDRAQTWLDFCTVAPDRGEPACLFRETTKAWVDDPGAPIFLRDGSFLLPSDRSGWKHLYHYEKTGQLKRQITSGEWEARTPHGVDEEEGWVYFSGTRDSPIASNLYRVRLDGSELERLTTEPGDHRVNVSPKRNLFIDSWSTHAKPISVHLRQTDGQLVRTLDSKPAHAREEYRLGTLELVKIPTPDGVVLEASVLKPPDFDPQRRYPVWFMTYAGPYSSAFPSQTVQDSWSGGRTADHFLATLGFIVFRCDPRSASGKGAGSAWTAYRQLGVQELKDIESAIGWLTKHPWVDASRIGMSGHSYGGYITAFALTHSKLFAAGIAGAPVTDWRNYDTIYTERYMNTPQENPKGYDASSVVKAARNLHGKLLLLHGFMDDNVHFQNTVQFVDELQRAGKDFEVMFYPRSRHGIGGRHFNQLRIDFMKRALLDRGDPAGAR